MSERLYGFEPVYASDARILICGSMPSVESLKQGFYYAHPRNAFWRMLPEIFGEETPATIEEKKALLIRHGLALWDSAASCERVGSLDSAICEPVANDFAALYRNCPDIKYVFFNGGKACELYKRLVCREDPDRRFIRLPSTSPAYTLPYSEKKSAWERAFTEVFHEHQPL